MLPSTMRFLATLVALPLALSASAQTLAVPPIPFEIVIAPVRSATGAVRIGLYSVPASFRKEAQAAKVVELPAHPGEMRARIDDLPAGRYAVMAYHDENANGKLDLRMGMFPLEGYGLSNNPKVIGPPSFEDSAFTVERAGQIVTIEMHY
ncbi:MAG TPA: DUF2141 domain-containing protein [Rhodocyclaceae bacterium]|nr:DUF2141 domain-containing protein [Rhodocyclaceae bacterium]